MENAAVHFLSSKAWACIKERVRLSRKKIQNKILSFLKNAQLYYSWNAQLHSIMRLGRSDTNEWLKNLFFKYLYKKSLGKGQKMNRVLEANRLERPEYTRHDQEIW